MGNCIVCKESWTGINKAHCTGCYRTFKGVNAFDLHRVGFKCKKPEDIGMVMKAGIWSKPMPDSQREYRCGLSSNVKTETLAQR